MKDEEIIELSQLLRIVDSIPAWGERGNSWRWTLTTDGVFTVKSAYKAFLGAEISPFAFNRMVWKVKSRLKVKFFMWLLTLGRTLTKMRRSIWAHDGDINCVFCGLIQDDEEHLCVNGSFI